MKKIPIILLVLVLLASAVLLTGCVTDKSRTTYCYDYKGIFNDYQTEQINEACQKATKKYNVTFLVATTGRTGKTADLVGDGFLSREGLSDEDDYVVIIINAKGLNEDYHFDIYTYGRAARRISDDEIDTTLYSIYGDYILSDNSGTAADGVVGLIDKLDGIPLWGNIVIGLIIGLVVAGIVAGGISKGYGRKRKNETYPLDKYCKLSLREHEDKFSRSVTTVTIINNNSGGGSRGGGGHSSGGGFGGGHRGGR